MIITLKKIRKYCILYQFQAPKSQLLAESCVVIRREAETADTDNLLLFTGTSRMYSSYNDLKIAPFHSKLTKIRRPADNCL